MLASLVRSEVFKLSRRMMPRILLLILIGGTIAIYGLLWLALTSSSESTDPETARSLEDLRLTLRVEAVRETGLDLVRTIGTILVIILGVSVISSEYSWGTIRTILPRAGDRAAFLTAKYLLLGAFVIALVLLGYVAALIGSAVVSSAEDLSLGLGENALPHTLAAIARTAFVMLPYTTLGFLIAVVTRSTAAGIAIGIVIFLGEGLAAPLIELLGEPFDRVPDGLLSRNVGAVMAANALPDTSVDPDLPSAWRAAGVLLLYTAGFVALAYRRFLTRDVTSGAE